MTFQEFRETEGLNEASNQYFLLYHVNTQRNGKETHNYYVWSVDDIKAFSSYAKGSTMKDCVDSLDSFFAKKITAMDKITLLGKVNGVEGPVSTANEEKPARTKEKAILALKKLCPKAVQVLNKFEKGDDSDEETNEATDRFGMYIRPKQGGSKSTIVYALTIAERNFKNVMKLESQFKAVAKVANDEVDQDEFGRAQMFIERLNSTISKFKSDVEFELDLIKKTIK